MMTSYFRLEVEIRTFCACAIKNMQYNLYLWPNRRNFRVVEKNRGRETQRWHQILDRKWKYGRFAHAQWKIRNITPIYGRIAEISASLRKLGSRNTKLTSDLRAEVEIWPFRGCIMHPATIIGTVHSWWTWLWGRYHVPRNVFLVIIIIIKAICNAQDPLKKAANALSGSEKM